MRERGLALGRTLSAGDARQVEHAVVLFMTHYMGVVEGLMAVSGYDYFEEMLGARGILPRLLEGIRLIRADEGRHLTHGMDYIRQQVAEHPECAEEVRQLFVEEGMKIPVRTDFIFESNDFGLDRERLMTLAYQHVQQRQQEAGVA